MNTVPSKIKPIAIYLPQFHPIPENDEWWGKGFTEWTNVAKAKPLFEGHYQPHLPADLGFYDLRLAEIREAQATMARDNGIHGFCYYHYWFNGKRILERPFNEVLSTGKPDFPFMLCWANENWTRIWDGGDKNVLLEQVYSAQDDIDHIRSLIPTFKDPRYIKVDGKPVFVVYRSTLLPDIKATITRWRNEALKEGLEIYLCRMNTFGETGEKFLADGFDAAINFEPFGDKFEDFKTYLKSKKIKEKYTNWQLIHRLFSRSKRNELLNSLNAHVDYNEYVDFVKSYPNLNYKCYPGITPGWDNSARKKKGYFLFKNSTPLKFKDWLVHEVQKFEPFSKDENFLFINAWNEWAEGNHLEPDAKWGTQHLQAVKDVLNNSTV